MLPGLQELDLQLTYFRVLEIPAFSISGFRDSGF